MRLKSEFFASALVRRIFSDGGFAAVEKKGETSAGAIFLRQRFRDGTVSIYGPAPQSLFAEGEAEDRRFEPRLLAVEQEEAEALLAREIRFDPDLWIVELETDRDIKDYVEVAA
jgi:hypothetical protein